MAVAEKRWVCNESVVFAELGDEAVLLEIDSGVYFGLDPVGARIWQLLDKASTMNEVVDTLLAEFDVERAVLDVDVAAFLARMREKGLIQEVDG